MTIAEARRAWAAAEKAAVDAESKLAAIGQACANPRMADFVRQAGELRQQADHLLRRLVELGLDERGEA